MRTNKFGVLITVITASVIITVFIISKISVALVEVKRLEGHRDRLYAQMVHTGNDPQKSNIQTISDVDLLGELTKYITDGVSITELTPFYHSGESEITVDISEVTVRGDFKSAQRYLHNLESKSQFSIISVDYSLEMNRTSRSEELRTKFIIHHIKGQYVE